MSFPFSNVAPARTRADEVGCVDGPPPGLRGLDELEGVAIPAAQVPAPLVIRCRSRTVAKVDSIGFVVRRWIPCSAG